MPTILGEIKRYFRDRTWSVRVPRDLQELALRVDRAVAELSRDLHRQPTVAEIGRGVGVSEEDVLEALEAVGRLPRDVARGAARQRGRGGRHARRHASAPRSGFGLAEDRATLEHLMRSITPREREVLRLRFERGPHPGRDRRAHRRLADAGLAASSASRSPGCACRARTGAEDAGARSGGPRPPAPPAAPRPAGRAAARSPSAAEIAASSRRLSASSGSTSSKTQHEQPERLAGDDDGHADARAGPGTPSAARGGGVEPRAVDVAQRAAELRDARRRSPRAGPSTPRRERGSTRRPLT